VRESDPFDARRLECQVAGRWPYQPREHITVQKQGSRRHDSVTKVPVTDFSAATLYILFHRSIFFWESVRIYRPTPFFANEEEYA
jgi:hypothetical protein